MLRRLALPVWLGALLMVFSLTAYAQETYYLTLYAREDQQLADSRKQYLQMVRSRVEGNKRYPLFARKHGQEGRIQVRFVIQDNGHLEAIELVTPCQHRALNEAALSAVRGAGPFPSLPPEVFSEPPGLIVELVFTLH